jgi:hypothetical protein
MASNSADDIHRLWQEQPAERPPQSSDDMRVTAQRFETRTRWWRNAGAAAVVVAVIAEAVQVVWPGRDLVERTGDLLTIAAFLYVAYLYRKYARVSPERLGLTSCLDFYRARLVYERNLAQQSGRYLLPFVPGVALGLLGGVLDQGIPAARKIAVAAFGVALFVGVAWLNAYTARRLQKELDALDAP